MKGRDIKFLSGLIPDDARVSINGNHDIEFSLLTRDNRYDTDYDLQISAGYTIVQKSFVDGLMKEIKHLYERLGRDAQ